MRLNVFCVLLGLVSGGPIFAAEAPSQDYQVGEISVLGRSGARSVFDVLPTAVQVSGTELERKRKATLGETLSREAGVSSSFFGPNSSRPVIRGLDGDRIRILENGVGMLDASSASPDHAVALDPLLVDSVEILRGPSALLYGGTAIGGVVNVRTQRIAETPLSEGRFDLAPSYSSVDQGKTLGAVVRTTLGPFVVHADASLRSSENYAIPGLARTAAEQQANPLAPGESEDAKVVSNSANRTSQAAFGISRPFDQGFIGASVSGYLSEYGTVAEKSVLIDLDRTRVDGAGEWRGILGLDSIRFKAAYSKYEHQEVDQGQVGTIFRNRGVESRVDAKSGAFLFGVQQQYFRLTALGNEAFLPTTRNASLASFGRWEDTFGRLKPAFGLRLDSAAVTSETTATFGPGVERSFFAPSASLGLQIALGEASQKVSTWTLGLNSTYSERAPNYQELFANGAHLATGIFEQGKSTFATEKNLGFEVSLNARDEAQEARATVFVQDFRNYIALSPTGLTDAGSGLEIYDFNAVQARLFGAELEYRYRLKETILSGAWDLDFKADWVRGLNLSLGQNLPRMVPVRGTLGLNYRQAVFSASLEYQRTEGQALLAPNERATLGYDLVNLAGEIPFHSPLGLFKGLVRVNNLFNVEARNAISLVKEIAPLPGRNLFAGLQASF